MKLQTRLFMGVAAATLLASCAHTDDRYVTSRSLHSVTDARYVAAVEQVAASRGVEVVWVNPPERRVDDKQQ
mgnify:CR=1 FL=1